LDPAVAFGQVLRRLRKEVGLSQEQLGFSADIQRKYVSLIELGDNQPTIRVLFKLANALGTTTSAMMAEVEDLIRASDKTAKK